MKKWAGIRHVRYLLSNRWKHYITAMKGVDKAVENAIKACDEKNITLSDSHIAVAQSWLEDAKYEWEHLQKIRDGEE